MINPVPIDISEGMIAHHRERARDVGRKQLEDDLALEALVAASAKMRKNATLAHEMAEAIRGDKSAAGVHHRQTYADDVAKLEAAAVKRMDEAMNACFGELGRVVASIKPPVPSDKFKAVQIRQAMKELFDADRTALPGAQKRGEQELLRASDAVIEALADAPAFVTGLSEEALAHRVKSWQTEKFPAEVARAKRLGDALNGARSVGVSFRSYVADLAKTMAQPIIEKSVKRTEAAREAVTAALAE